MTLLEQIDAHVLDAWQLFSLILYIMQISCVCVCVCAYVPSLHP